METTTERTKRSDVPWKWIVTVAAIAGLLILARTLPVSEWLTRFNGWIGQLGGEGMVIYAFVYVLAALLFLPGSVLTAGAGFAFGVVWGTLVVSLSATTAAALAFLIARHLARDWIVAKAERDERFRAIDHAVGREGWKIVGLLRLSPAIPFNLSNYLYGLTSVRFWPYVLVSWVGMLPGTLLYVYIGAAGKAGLQAASGVGSQRGPLEYRLFGVGLLSTIIVTIMVTRIARKALQR